METQAAHPMRENYVSELASAAHALLVEVEFFSKIYNGIAAELQFLGYPQAGRLMDAPVYCGDDTQLYHSMAIFPQSQGGTAFITTDQFLGMISEGPQRDTHPSRDRKIEKDRPKRPSGESIKRIRLLREIGEAAEWTCVYCARVGAPSHGPDKRMWHIDHVYPKAAGGDNKPDNLALSCATCNLRKNASLASEILAATKKRISNGVQ